MTQAELDALWELTLGHLGIAVTQDCLDFHTSWHHREGGSAKWNSLNTTWKMPGSTAYNSVGVQNYPDITTGAIALANTLRLPYYKSIIAGLQTGNPWTLLPTMGSAFGTWSGGGYTTIAVYHSNPQPIEEVMPPIIYRVTSTGVEFTPMGTLLVHLDGESAKGAPANAEIWTVSDAVYANLKDKIIG